MLCHDNLDRTAWGGCDNSRVTQRPDNSGVAIFLTLLALGLFLVVVAGLGAEPAAFPAEATSTAARADATRPSGSASPSQPATSEPPAGLPHGGDHIFDGRMLVAYYGTAGTGVLGVLGETDPERALTRLTHAARPFTRAGLAPQPVFELIVTVADRHPGRDRDYSHDIARDAVEEYVDAAHRLGVLLLLDIQPGRSPFDRVARRWAWALEHPWVGLALDPEWRMGARQVPGHTIGSVTAAEVNRTSAWLDDLTARHQLPEKLFVLHQFRTTMIQGIDRIRRRPHLAMVQHVDGFGTQRQKLATYGVVAVPQRFRMGFKLFYDEDIRLMSPRQVAKIRPRVEFVSYQ